jgi:hypothetical protein
LDLSIWYKDTAEGDEDTDDNRVNERGEDGIRGISCDKLAKTCVEEPCIMLAWFPIIDG